ncbi:hypothetical protein BACCIP111895_00998 [Neobacillus rhizosphaerae]|uniref:Uncharacterized protein n=1 Tax=Neobacillus rhizosphaerae TaxID=2880965 RepID=A0ABM9EMK5_9BACI|nr:hypothetical protein [Neobacillus rhizosphaerae]CAH2713844.1 hypothetical protein BACCIP111895_00998 [Neobacillus rhizosphaerae]
MQLKIGDWVTQYSAGIYRVEKIFEFKNHQPIAVLKKGFTNKLKPSVSWDSCSISFCETISDDLLKEIKSIFENNSKFSKRFNDYDIPPIQMLFNTNVVLKDKHDKETVISQLKFPEGKTIQQIESLLFENDIEILDSEQSKDSVPFQLTCFDYETDSNGEFIYRDARFI